MKGGEAKDKDREKAESIRNIISYHITDNAILTLRRRNK